MWKSVKKYSFFPQKNKKVSKKRKKKVKKTYTKKTCYVIIDLGERL